MKIDKEIKSLIPLLTLQEFNLLEISLKKEGCRDCLVVWKEKDILLDGHNRYKICKRYKLKYKIQQKSFSNKDAAKEWVITNQFGRRNLSIWKRALMALKLKPIIAAQAKERQRGGQGGKLLNLNSKEANTIEQLSEISNVSTDTIWKVETILREATHKILGELEKEKMTLNQAYVLTKDGMKGKLNQGKYDVLYITPPWDYEEEYTGKEKIQDTHHYTPMSIEELCELPVSEITEENAVLFIWADVCFVMSQKVFQIIKAWGFKYKACFVWDKRDNTKYGEAQQDEYCDLQHELLLIATKGNRLPDHRKLYDSVQKVEQTEYEAKHDCKPLRFRQIISDIYRDGRFLELFPRGKKMKKWDVWRPEKLNQKKGARK